MKDLKIDESTGLVLEGGGMRGVFTCGVLDYFMDHDIRFPYAIGVSAGACYAPRHAECILAHILIFCFIFDRKGNNFITEQALFLSI